MTVDVGEVRPWPEVAELLPALSESERRLLAGSLERRTLHELPILVMADGRIIDGHHRWELSHGTVAVSRVDLDEEEAFGLAIALNISRRQLSGDQLRELGHRIDKLGKAQRKQIAYQLRQNGMTQEQAAAVVGVAQPTVAGWESETSDGSNIESDNASVPLSQAPDLRIVIPPYARDAIRARLVAGETVAQVAAEYKVSERRVRQLRAADPQYRVEPEPPAEPEPIPGVRIEVGDSTALPLDDCSVDLQITSPTYGVDKAYDGTEDASAGWLDYMAAWLAESFRVAKVGGRLALNVPLDTTRGGYRPTYAQAVQIAINAGWTYRSTIVWNEGNVNKSVARGSVDSPAAPHIIAPVEMIPVFSKGTWKRESEQRPDISHDDWLEWTNGLWTFGGESNAWEGHPAPFPEELPRRLILLLSFPRDVVLDQHGGSFTTALVARRLGRGAISFDTSLAYVQSGRRRLLAGVPA